MHTHDSHWRHSAARPTSNSNGGTQVWGGGHTYPHYSPHPRRCDGRAVPMGHVNGALVCGGFHTYSHFPTISVGHVTGVGVWSYLLTNPPIHHHSSPPHFMCVFSRTFGNAAPRWQRGRTHAGYVEPRQGIDGERHVGGPGPCSHGQCQVGGF